MNMNYSCADRHEEQASIRKTLRFRVDNVPPLIRPLYLAVMWVVAVVLYLYYALCRITSHISIEGPGNRDLTQHSIFCMWHESWSYFVVFLRYRSAGLWAERMRVESSASGS